MKKNQVFLIIAGLLVVTVIIGYVSFSFGEKPKKKMESKKLSALLGGTGSGDSSSENLDKKRGHKNNEKSLWDEGDFMKSGVVYTDDDTGPDLGNKELGEIPINPQTGKPWEEDAMQQFDELRKLFADNDLIPKRMSREEKDKQAQLDIKWSKAQNAVNSGTYTRDDLDNHFDHQKKVVEDRLQIIEYLIETQKEEGEEDKDGQFQKILDGTKEQMKQLEVQKTEMAKKLGG